MLSNAPTPEELDVKRYVLHLNDGSTQTVESTNVFSACHKLGWGSGDIQMRLKYAEELPSYDALRLSLEAARGEMQMLRGQLAGLAQGNVAKGAFDLYAENQSMRRDLDAAHAKLAGAREAFTKFANHSSYCKKLSQMPMEQGRTYTMPTDWDNWRNSQPCTCGFETSLAALVEARND